MTKTERTLIVTSLEADTFSNLVQVTATHEGPTSYARGSLDDCQIRFAVGMWPSQPPLPDVRSVLRVTISWGPEDET